MARYIDADKFKNDLAQACVHKAIVTNVLDRQPTADVAPKSEVAREIFEEIESMFIRYTFDDDYISLGIRDEFAELKKKYTEDKT